MNLGGRSRPTVTQARPGPSRPIRCPTVRVQSPSPCPPSESKFHDLIWPLWGSQPMNIVPEVGLLTLDVGGVGADQVAVVVGPADIGLDLVVSTLVDPVADHPLQLAEPLEPGRCPRPGP